MDLLSPVVTHGTSTICGIMQCLTHCNVCHALLVTEELFSFHFGEKKVAVGFSLWRSLFLPCAPFGPSCGIEDVDAVPIGLTNWNAEVLAYRMWYML